MPDHPHVDRALAWCREVAAGKTNDCKKVRQACQRHLRDVERSKDPDWPYRFDATKAERICRFGELLPHVKGDLARIDPKTGRTYRIKLEPAQCFVLSMLFGWVKKKNGRRRFNRGSVYIPRGNAKSTLAVIIALWMFAKDDEPGAEVFCGATSEKQAMEVLRPALQMCQAEPGLREACGIEVRARTLIREAANARFEAIIGKPGDGSAPHCAIVDEYHEHADSTQYDTMKTGMGKRSQPLILVISTAGADLSGPCRDDWNEAEKLLDGVFEDETFFAIIWTVDDPAKWMTEEALAMANPLWRIAVDADQVLPFQKAAIRDPIKQAAFKTKHLNLWVGAAKGWLNMESWKACGDPSLDFDAFAKHDCWVGLDAASRIDMTSMAVVFRRGDEWVTFANHYIPEATVALPQNQHYRNWVAAGYLIPTPGHRVDFTVIEADLRAWSDRFNIQQLAFDPKELNDLINRVALWASFERVEVKQGAQLISAPMKEMEALVETGKLRHENDPLLTWMASNVVKKQAPGGGPVKYYFPAKTKDENKIDGIMALLMALSRGMVGAGAERSVYATRGIETV